MSNTRVPVRELLRALGINGRKKGKRWWAQCPGAARMVSTEKGIKQAHEGGIDRSPSWMIWDDDAEKKRGLHYCFACGFSGSAVFLVMHMRSMLERDAIAWLRDLHAGVRQEPVAALRVESASPYGRVVGGLEDVVFDDLRKWVTPAREYVLARGIEPWQVERWRLGYSVDGRLAFRVVIVARNRAGVPLNYTARTFVDDDPRYLNGREQDGIDHGALFGEEHWPDPDQRDVVIATEGAINGLAAEIAAPGMPFGALSGSNVHPSHVAKLSTFKRVVVATDADRAGDKAAEDLRTALGRWIDVTRARPPEGLDLAAMPIDDRRVLLEGAWRVSGRRAS